MDRAANISSVRTPSRGPSWRELAWVIPVLLAVTAFTRMATFGHPDLYVDEAFYFAAGVETLHGAIPYVDVWDRKPPGHFLLYALIAAISDWYPVYQIAAGLFAAATATVIHAAARGFATRSGALMGAILYLLSICLFNGHGGQSAVFYNLFVAASGALVFASLGSFDSAKGGRMLALAMLLAGIAISIKTTAVFEAVFFGLFAATKQFRLSGMSRATLVRIAIWAGLGALPTLLFTAWYAAHGYWDEYWTAMVLSNLRKHDYEIGGLRRFLVLAGMLLPFALAAIFALARMAGERRTFLAGWLVAAFIGFVSVPAFYLHYALPLLVPLCITGAGFYERKPFGITLFGLLMFMNLKFFPYFDFAATRYAQGSMDKLVAAVESGKGDGPLLVFDGPPLLYTLTGSRFPTPLAFPNHLHQEAERNVSHIDTLAEVKRILAERPGAIVDRTTSPTNKATTRLVRAYEKSHCTEIAAVPMVEGWNVKVKVYGNCRERALAK
jgi:hypothetical protein